MCRVINPDPLRKANIANKTFKQLDSLVATLFPSVASPDLVRFGSHEQYWQDFCFTTSKVGNPFLDDNIDDHGFIRMPWIVSIGLNYAFIEVRQGTWY